MSDPKVWNGTGWVRPRFWDGATWLEYIDPVYSTPAFEHHFTASAEGWTSNGEDFTWNPEGYLSAWGYDTFIWGGCNFASPRGTYDTELSGKAGHTVEARLVYRAIPYPGTDVRQYIGTAQCVMQAPYYSGGLTLEAKDFEWISDSVWRQVVTGRGVIQSTERGSLWDVYGNVDWNMSALGGGQPSTYVHLDQFVLWDVTANEPLKALSNALWEPRVFDGLYWK